MFEEFDKDDKPVKATKPKTNTPKSTPKKTITSKKKEQLATEIIYKTETVLEMLIESWSRFQQKGSSHGSEMRKVLEKIEEYKKL